MDAMRYNKKNNDIDTHIEDATIHKRSANAILPSATENQTLRKGALNWESTSVLKIHVTGPENTVDHSTGTNPRMVNIVYAASPGTLVVANTVPVGTVGFIYTP